MAADDKTKYEKTKYREAADVEAHKFVVEEPSEDEADKTKTRSKYRKPDELGKSRSKY